MDFVRSSKKWLRICHLCQICDFFFRYDQASLGREMDQNKGLLPVLYFKAFVNNVNVVFDVFISDD